jgi:hypothetical protein
MVHIALVVVAVLSAGWLALMLISLIFRGFGRTPGCISLVVAAVMTLVASILAFRL